MDRATIVPGQSGTIAVVVDKSAFETKNGDLTDLALQIFRGDGLLQVAVALEALARSQVEPLLMSTTQSPRRSALSSYSRTSPGCTTTGGVVACARMALQVRRNALRRHSKSCGT